MPKRITRLFAVAILFMSFFSSCSYKHKNVLFKTDEKVNSKVPVLVLNPEKKDSSEAYRHRVKIGSRLRVRFLNNYDIGQNAIGSPTSGVNANDDPDLDRGYLVNYDSTVILPLIGRVNLVGLTRSEAALKLEKLYGQFIINPIIDVNIANLTATILGEVVLPKQIELDKDNTTVVDAIAMAGGLKDAGKKNIIKIIRGKEVIIVNLRTVNSLKDPNIILHDNDVVYVEPFKIKSETESLTGLSNITTLIITISQVTLLTLQIYTLTK